MKIMQILFIMIFSLSSFAINSYRAKDYTCEELKEILEEEGKIRVKSYKFLPPSIYKTLENVNYCTGYGKEIIRTFSKSSDTKKCQLGYRCFVTDPDGRYGR